MTVLQDRNPTTRARGGRRRVECRDDSTDCCPSHCTGKPGEKISKIVRTLANNRSKYNLNGTQWPMQNLGVGAVPSPHLKSGTQRNLQ